MNTLVMLLGALVAGAFAQPICPTYLRAVHSFMPSAAGVPPVDYYVNGAKIQTMNFRDVTSYIAIPPGRLTIAIRSAGALSSSAPLASAELTVAVGKFYTAGFLGTVPGPVGQRVYSQVPIIVNEDVRTVPNPSRFNGLWYRWSETNLVIDFRTIAGDPTPPSGVVSAADSERISILQPKTVIPIAELPSGVPYSFYPCGVGSNAPLANPRLPGGYVAVRNLVPKNGTVYDFFATGDTLVNANDYNLQVGYTETPLTFDPASGCTLAGAASAATFAQASDTATVDRVDRVTIATLTLLCVCTVILVANLAISVLSRAASASTKAVVTSAA